MEKKRQSLLSRVSTLFRAEYERAKKRREIREAFSEVQRLVKRRIPLADEYYFKGACAGLIETCGFIPSSYILDISKMTIERNAAEDAGKAPCRGSFRFNGRIN